MRREIFYLIFSFGIFSLLIEQTDLYARRKKKFRRDFKARETNLRRFIGILLLNGYHSLTQEDGLLMWIFLLLLCEKQKHLQHGDMNF